MSPQSLLLAAALATCSGTSFAGGNDNAVPLATRYSVVDIGGLGGDTTIPQAIDSRGRVVGFATRAGSEFQHGFVTGPDGQGISDICPDHPWACGAYAIADNGEIVGAYDAQEWADSTCFSMFVDGTGFAPLRMTPTSTQVTPAGVNDGGQVVGTGLAADFHAQAFATRGGGRSPMDLGALVAGGSSAAHAINGDGVVVGEADADATHRRAFVKLASRAPMRDLGALNGNNSAALAISSNGIVAGWSEVDIFQHHHAFAARADHGALVDLGTLGGSYSSGNAVNAHGVVVGQSSLDGDRLFHAFAADARGGRIVDLNDVADLPPGVELITARAINDRGQIVCTAFDQHAYLLTPIR